MVRRVDRLRTFDEFEDSCGLDVKFQSHIGKASWRVRKRERIGVS
jgi:hypothetical protein